MNQGPSISQISALLMLSSFLLSGCGGSSTDAPPASTPAPDTTPEPEQSTLPPNNLTNNQQGDISYLTLTNRNPDCGAYVGQYHADIIDVQQQLVLESELTVTSDNDSCTFTSNNIPNHDVGEDTTTGKDFASAVQQNTVGYVVSVPRQPQKTDIAKYVQKIAAKLTLNGILLNGVDLDMDSAFCYHPDINAPLNVGLGTRQQCGLNADWYAVPAYNKDIVTLDKFTGHAFDGRYHYHGDNEGLSTVVSSDSVSIDNDNIDLSGSPVIGFAPDGFPIYGHYFFDNELGELREIKSSWTTLSSERATDASADFDAPPISTHPRGMFVEDWVYEPGFGDLDECNGMTDAYGNYGYYYTKDYPYGPICTFGAPDSSFTLDSSAFIGQ